MNCTQVMSVHAEHLAEPACWLRLTEDLDSILSHFRADKRMPPFEAGPYEHHVARNHSIDKAFLSSLRLPPASDAIEHLRTSLDAPIEDDGYAVEIWESSETYHKAIRRGLLLLDADDVPHASTPFAEAMSIRVDHQLSMIHLEPSHPHTFPVQGARVAETIKTNLRLQRFGASPSEVAHAHMLVAQWSWKDEERLGEQHGVDARRHLEHVCRLEEYAKISGRPGKDTSTTEHVPLLATAYMFLAQINETSPTRDANLSAMQVVRFTSLAIKSMLDWVGGDQVRLDSESIDFLLHGADLAISVAVRLPCVPGQSELWAHDVKKAIKDLLVILDQAGSTDDDKGAARHVMYAQALYRMYNPRSDSPEDSLLRRTIELTLQAVIDKKVNIGSKNVVVTAYSVLGQLANADLGVLLFPAYPRSPGAATFDEDHDNISACFRRAIEMYEAALEMAESNTDALLVMLAQLLVRQQDYQHRTGRGSHQDAHDRLTRLVSPLHMNALRPATKDVLYHSLGMSCAINKEWDAACAAYTLWMDVMDTRQKQTEHALTRAERYVKHKKGYAHASLSQVKSTGDVLLAMMTLERGRGRELRQRLLLSDTDAVQPPLTLQGDMQLATMLDFATLDMKPEDDIRAAIESGWPLLYINPTHFGTSLLGGSKVGGRLTWHAEFIPDATAITTAEHARLSQPRDPECTSWENFGKRVQQYSNYFAKHFRDPLNSLIERWRNNPEFKGITVILCGVAMGAPLSVLDAHGSLDVPLRYAPSAFALRRMREQLATTSVSPRLLALGVPSKGTAKPLPASHSVLTRMVAPLLEAPQPINESSTPRTPSAERIRSGNDVDTPIKDSVRSKSHSVSSNMGVDVVEEKLSPVWDMREHSDALDGVPVECESVASLFPADHAKVLQSPNATLRALQDNWHNKSHVLLSCHGDVNLRDRSSSCVYLSDGPVTASELPSYLKQSSAQAGQRPDEIHKRLIFISSCHTAQPSIIAPDEPLSLPIAFIIAGSPCVIACQWVLPDSVGTLLSLRFFHLHLNGLDPATALYESQKWLRNLSKPFASSLKEMHLRHPALEHLGLEKIPGKFPLRNPVYWAGWVCVGI